MPLWSRCALAARPLVVRGARKLVEQDGVQILIGPLSGSEGIAVKDYAKTQPKVTFLNGSSAARLHRAAEQSGSSSSLGTRGTRGTARDGAGPVGTGGERRDRRDQLMNLISTYGKFI